MARVWIYDRQNDKRYREAVAKAKTAKRTPPGRWQVRWYDPAGKPKARTFVKKPQAEAYKTDIEAKLAEGVYRDPAAGKVRFREMAEAWLAARSNLKRSTRSKYRDALDVHILGRWGDLPLSAIEFEDIAVWIVELHQGKGLSASHVRGIHRVLSMVLDWCVPRRIPVNPAKGVPLPKLPPSDHVYLSHDQVEDLADAIGSLTTKHGHPLATAKVNRTLVLLLAYTGLRWGEAAALRVRSVDLGKRRIRVVSAFAEDDGELYEDTPKTGERRSVPVPRFLVAELEPLLAGRDADALVFTTDRGNPLRLRNWRYREFAMARKKAGLDGIGLTPHKLRHTAASLAIAAGADVYVVQKMLGHAKPSMTLDVYGHLWPDRLDEVADILDVRRSETARRRAE